MFDPPALFFSAAAAKQLKPETRRAYLQRISSIYLCISVYIQSRPRSRLDGSLWRHLLLRHPLLAGDSLICISDIHLFICQNTNTKDIAKQSPTSPCLLVSHCQMVTLFALNGDSMQFNLHRGDVVSTVSSISVAFMHQNKTHSLIREGCRRRRKT